MIRKNLKKIGCTFYVHPIFYLINSAKSSSLKIGIFNSLAFLFLLEFDVTSLFIR